MADKKLRLKVATPAGFAVDQDCDMVIMRCTDGDMGVLPGHESTSVILDYGIMRLFEDGVEHKIAVFGGIGEIDGDTLTILTHSAQWPEDIDRDLAQSDRENAELRLQEKRDDLDIRRDQVLLRRALVQIEVGAHVVANVDKDA